MSNTYCVVFLLCLSSSCFLNVASFSGLSIFNIPSVLSSVYLLMFLLTIYVHVIENMTMFVYISKEVQFSMIFGTHGRLLPPLTLVKRGLL